MNIPIALLGYGNVGRAFVELVQRKGEALRRDVNLAVTLIGIATKSHGAVIDPDGLDLEAVRRAKALGEPMPTLDFIARCPAAAFLEATSTNPFDGQPALDFVRAALRKGAHVVSANKGPVVFAHRELQALAREKGVGFFFESTVMDGAPVLGVGREGLPGADIRRIRGIFNSTTNLILTLMETAGMAFDAALAETQRLGLAETDPTLDVDGWDASIKTAILANVLMGADLRPADVDRQGIAGIAREDVLEAAKNGERIRLVCEASRAENGRVQARVAPERVPMHGALGSVMGTTSIVEFETDMLPCLTIVEHDPGPMTTAYGMLVDLVNLARGRAQESAE
jgi:homoserine dehydrogenase